MAFPYEREFPPCECPRCKPQRDREEREIRQELDGIAQRSVPAPDPPLKAR